MARGLTQLTFLVPREIGFRELLDEIWRSPAYFADHGDELDVTAGPTEAEGGVVLRNGHVDRTSPATVALSPFGRGDYDSETLEGDLRAFGEMTAFSVASPPRSIVSLSDFRDPAELMLVGWLAHSPIFEGSLLIKDSGGYEAYTTARGWLTNGHQRISSYRGRPDFDTLL